MIANYIDQIIMFGAGVFSLYVARLMREGRVGDRLDPVQRRTMANFLRVVGPLLMVAALLIAGLKYFSGGQM